MAMAVSMLVQSQVTGFKAFEAGENLFETGGDTLLLQAPDMVFPMNPRGKSRDLLNIRFASQRTSSLTLRTAIICYWQFKE